MKIHVRQVYIKPGVWFEFSHHFQRFLAAELSSYVSASDRFIKDFGPQYEVTFNVSAKRQISANEIKGPSVFKRTKDVEFTIFLPFDKISGKKHWCSDALEFLFDGISSVFASLEIDMTEVNTRRESIITRVCSDPIMFKSRE